MTPAYKIKKEILLQASKDIPELTGLFDTPEQVEAYYEEFTDNYDYQDWEEIYRRGQVTTNIPATSAGYYESRSVAAKLSDGSWVGWTYWYGGGKHGQPGEMDWMGEAYDLDCVEEEKLVLLRTFTKK